MTTSTAPAALAPHHLRLFALIVDYLLIITLLKLLDQLALGENWDLQPVSEGGLGFSPWWAAGLAMLMACKDAINGQSLGKWLTGIAVAAMPGLAEAPGARRSILRNLTLVLLPLDAAFVFIDPHGRRLGDRLAGTVVVVPCRGSHLLRRLMVMAILFLAFMLASFLVAPWNMKRSAAYQMAYRAAAEDPRVVRALGAPVRPDSSPRFKLTLDARGGSAELDFEVEGPRGEGSAEVVLRLAEASRRWRLESVRFYTAEHTAEQAAQKTSGKGGKELEPLVKKAPPRPKPPP